MPLRLLSLIACLLAPSALLAKAGLFENATDVGAPELSGRSYYDPVWEQYTLTGSGANMWGERDAFHFLHTRREGDWELSARITFVGEGVNAHRKACLLFRQTLEPGSPYVDVALHGDGLTSLQFRAEAGGPTREVRSRLNAPERVKLRKRGAHYEFQVGNAAGGWDSTGCSVELPMDGPLHIGLGVCAHETDVRETAVFSDVTLTPLPPMQTTDNWRSSLEIINIHSGDRRSIYHTKDLIEAPNWLADDSLVFNSKGRLYRLYQDGPQAFRPQEIDTGFATRCNNDHGPSPDGKWMAISDNGNGQSQIYVVPIEGGTPRLVTPKAPSYWHGWSPDGKWVTYCAERGGEYDVYKIPVAGGEEVRLTDAPMLDDGPEYSPDGKFIYFNSARTGTMQIWRMRPDGSEQEQLTFDAWNDWFAHPSPDGRWLVFVSYPPEIDAQAHPRDKNVKLRIMPAEGGEIRELAAIFGGQGTINVPSWSPDSQHFAYVRYQPEQD